MPENIYQVTLC